jgi:hypothetical protein
MGVAKRIGAERRAAGSTRPALSLLSLDTIIEADCIAAMQGMPDQSAARRRSVSTRRRPRRRRRQ